VDIWCTYEKFSDAAASVIQIWELALTLWYTLLVTGYLPDNYEIACHIIIWPLSLFLGSVEFFIYGSAKIQPVINFQCIQNPKWSLIINSLFISITSSIILLLIFVSCFIRIKAPAATQNKQAFKFFWHILMYPIVFVACVLPPSIISILRTMGMGPPPLVVIIADSGAYSIGLLSALCYGFTRNIWKKIFEKCMRGEDEKGLIADYHQVTKFST